MNSSLSQHTTLLLWGPIFIRSFRHENNFRESCNVVHLRRVHTYETYCTNIFHKYIACNIFAAQCTLRKYISRNLCHLFIWINKKHDNDVRSCATFLHETQLMSSVKYIPVFIFKEKTLKMGIWALWCNFVKFSPWEYYTSHEYHLASHGHRLGDLNLTSTILTKTKKNLLITILKTVFRMWCAPGKGYLCRKT